MIWKQDMSENAALVPVPFYAPVWTGTGSPFKYSESPRRLLPVERQDRTVLPEAGSGLVYNRDAHYTDDTRLGLLVNIYA